MRYVLYAVLLLFSACHRQGVVPDTTLQQTLWGQWIESSARQDTLTFRQLSAGFTTRVEGFVDVRRGRADNGAGFIVPKLGSGTYQFYVEGQKIYVYNLLSSTFQFAPYTFLYNDPGKGYASSLTPSLNVGNFFELNVRVPETGVKTFVRLP